MQPGSLPQFNLNVLVRINRELGANFNLRCFEHHAFFNRERSRIEMHLASIKRQKVRILGETIEFRAGETIHTENSYKYTLRIVRRAGARLGLGFTPRVDRPGPVFRGVRARAAGVALFRLSAVITRASG